MSRRFKKNAAINTESLGLDVDSENAVATRLKEREIKYVKIKDSAELHNAYNFGDEIGRGAFGHVLKIMDKHTDKDWAMKIVSKAAAGNRIEMVYREIKILRMVDHPHVIYLDRVYESARKIYLILELCYSVLSNDFMKRKQFSETETRKIIGDLANTIAYLHKNDIVHRDLKLDNILVTENPNDSSDKLFIKVTDFGLSIFKTGSGYENMLHDCCGTLIYMAPEVIATHSYSQQCDIWAIGVIMYTLLSGHYPFYSKNEQELANMICKKEPTLSDFPASAEAINLITKALAKNPALRLTAGEMVHHPWIIGKPMKHDADSPQNVLDMMRLWRSEMMLPIGAESDWVTYAKAYGSSNPAVVTNPPEPEDPPSSTTATPTTSPARSRKQSIRQPVNLPVRNIRFQRPANQHPAAQVGGRFPTNTVCVDEQRTTNRRVSGSSPQTSSSSVRRISLLASNSPKRSANTSKLAVTRQQSSIPKRQPSKGLR